LALAWAFVAQELDQGTKKAGVSAATCLCGDYPALFDRFLDQEWSQPDQSGQAAGL